MTEAATATTSTSPFTTAWPRKLIEPSRYSSSSFPNATALPAKLTLPIRIPRKIVSSSTNSPWLPAFSSLMNSARAISATAPPPTPLKAATNCGIEVIGTLVALTTPMTDPTPTAIAISSRSSKSASKSVTITAISIPTAAITLPCRAVAGSRSRRMPAMKRSAASR